MPKAKAGSQPRQTSAADGRGARKRPATRGISAASSGINGGATPGATAPAAAGKACDGRKRARGGAISAATAPASALRAKAPRSAQEAVGPALRSRDSSAAGPSSSCGRRSIAAAAVERGNQKRKAEREASAAH